MSGQSDETLVVLAGGKASRLGLFGIASKALLNLGSDPIVANQFSKVADRFARLRVVVGPGDQAAQQLLTSLAGPLGVQVDFTVQGEPLGPGHAFALACRDLEASGLAAPIVVILADTYFEKLPRIEGSWIGTAVPPVRRTWMLVQSTSGQVSSLADCVVGPDDDGARVACGIYQLHNASAAYRAARLVLGLESSQEIQISHMLDQYMTSETVRVADIDGWMDCGELQPVQNFARHRIRSRHFNRIEISGDGVLIKQSEDRSLEHEFDYYRKLPVSKQRYFPRFYRAESTASRIVMDWLDVSPLSFYQLYQSGPLDDWVKISEGLLNCLDHGLWPVHPEQVSDAACSSSNKTMFVDKLWERWKLWAAVSRVARLDHIEVNGIWTEAGYHLISQLCDELLAVANRAHPGFIHGDLAFSNILYSPRVGSFRFVDPRGSYGSLSAGFGDVRYDLAKLRHSYAGGYESLIGGLYRLTWRSAEVADLAVAPDRSDIAAVFDNAIQKRGHSLADVRLIEASLLLSSVPLHSEDRRRQECLYLQGLIGARRALGAQQLENLAHDWSSEIGEMHG